jgi:hypothetical protein
MATIKFLLGIICIGFIGSNSLPGRYLLIGSGMKNKQDSQRQALVEMAEHELGVRELTGNNDGERVEAYLASAGLKKGQPWCAAYISWVYARMGYGKPRSGWCPDLFPSSRLARSALPGNVLGIYFSQYKRIAHVGLIVQQKGNWVTSVEGNTNVTGSREGDGVYKKIRHIRTIRSIADWITEGRILK